MDRLLNVQTALSLGYVCAMVLAAHLAGRALLASTATRKTRLIFLWLAFDAICHLTLEGSFLYLSVRGRTVNASKSFFGFLWQEYAAADARWGTADPTLVSMEFLTVLVAGPMAGYCAWLLAKDDPTYYYWVTVLSAGEIYGGWMTFAPEWLAGSAQLDTSNWLLLWLYLVFMNVVWVALPLWLMLDSYLYIAGRLRSEPARVTRSRSTKQQRTMVDALTSARGLSGSAYTLLLVGVFLYMMPASVRASSTPQPDAGKPAYDPAATTVVYERTDSLGATLKSVLVPIFLPLFLILFSVTVGAVQVADKALRRVHRTNRTRRRKLLGELGIDEKAELAADQLARTIIGFFHPYCNAGGGGERVLYEAAALHLARDPRAVVVIYTGDFPAASKEQILAKASTRFGISLDAGRVAMVGLKRRWMVEEGAWKSWTLLGQSYGSVWLAFEALSQLVPDVYVDTMGYAFSYVALKLIDRKVRTGAYVHYPIISTDMLRRVQNRQAGHTNDAATANSKLRSRVKLVYYRVFARLYSWALRHADALVANGSWTQAHLKTLLGAKHDVHLVYPPCDTEELTKFALEPRAEPRTIVSLAQFRPEKEHPTQLRVLKALYDLQPQLFSGHGAVKLVMMGSSRNEADEARIEMLRGLAKQLRIDAHVQFVVNADYPTIVSHLARAGVGLSTMKDEHFGINVVEFMAAGLLTLSHRSAGPWLDIATPSVNLPAQQGAVEKSEGVGWHARDVDEYAETLAQIMHMLDADPLQVQRVRANARARAQTMFGRRAFEDAWMQHLWSPLTAGKDKSKSE